MKLQTHKEAMADKGPKYLLHEELSISDKPRSLSVLHASELTKESPVFCARERAFHERDGDRRADDFLGTATNITYQWGRWIEHQVRNSWLRKFAIGHWSCTQCEHEHRYQTVPKSCEGCGASGCLLEYIEPRATCEKYGTSCGLDLLLWRNSMVTIIEIKSIDKDQFKDLKAPFSEHSRRTKLYIDLLAQSEWTKFDVKLNLDYAYVLYVCKAFGYKDDYEGREGVQDTMFSPFKEYQVKAASKKSELKIIYDRANEVRKFKKSGALPKRHVCPSPMCRRAEKCEYRKECFTTS